MKKLIKLFVFGSVFFICFSKNMSAQSSDEFELQVESAAAVIMEDNIAVTILGKNSAVYTVHMKILINNKNAENYCTVSMRESEYRSVSNIQAKIIDMDGNLLKELDDDNIEEAELSPGFILYSGNKYKWYRLTCNDYPYIIDYKYTVEIASLFFWPDWFPQSKIPCLSSTYTLLFDEPVEFNYHSMGVDVEPEKIQNNKGTGYKWKLENILPVTIEDYMLPEKRHKMMVRFSPANFVLDGYQGSFNDWNSFGKWYKSLTSQRYSLDAKAKADIKELIKDITDKKQIVSILYKYLQSRNRYVAIQLGIGGWQPQSALDVYKNRYGDCKDLSTLMVSMLDAAGIKSYPALALTRDKGMVLKEFPSNQFNHCITYVPLGDDTLWLECTSSYGDMLDTPYNIEDINVLAIDDDGGKLIKTPQKESSSNIWNSSITGKLDNKGNLTFNAVINTGGNQKNYLKNNLIVNNSDDDLIFLKNLLGRVYSNLVIENYSAPEPEIHSDYYVKLNGIYKKFNPKRGKRIFINPNIFNKKTANSLPDESVEKRKSPVFYRYPYLDVDTVCIEIPEGYKVNYMPENADISYSFANYSSEYRFEEGKIHYVRRFEITKNIIPVTEYGEYLEFSKQVIKSDKAKYIFVR